MQVTAESAGTWCELGSAWLNKGRKEDVDRSRGRADDDASESRQWNRCRGVRSARLPLRGSSFMLVWRVIYELDWRFVLILLFCPLGAKNACLICRLKTSEQIARNGSRMVKHHLDAPSLKSAMLSPFCHVGLYINMYYLRYIPLFV